MSKVPCALQVISTGGLYGAERVLLELAAFLATHGWNSRILAMDRGAHAIAAEAKNMGLAASVLDAGGAFAQASAFKRFIDELQPDVIHSHGYKPDILLHFLGVPDKRTCFATCHTWYSDSAKMKLFELLDKRALRRFERVFVVSSELETDVKNSGIAAQKVALIPNGIAQISPAPGSRERLRTEFGVGDKDSVILRLGRLAESKGNRYLLDACSMLAPDIPWIVVFAGDGEEAQLLAAQAATLGIASRVKFLGFRSDVADLIGAADVVAMPSLKEGMPMVLLEAMSSLRPVVVTDVGEMGNLVRSGDAGWIVCPADAGALSVALAEAVSNRTLASKRAENAFRLYRSSYSREAMGGRYFQAYEAIAQSL